ncbi:MAG TPA: hypothetical protein VFZ97_12965 [Acidimicrobiales bacterium]
MLIASLGVVAIGAALPFTPCPHALGFRSLPAGYFGALLAMIVAYLTLVELGSASSSITGTRASPLPATIRSGDPTDAPPASA